jgi:hypothetical protein
VATLAYTTVGIAANAASPSRIERAVGIPLSVSGALLAAAAYREERQQKSDVAHQPRPLG